MCLSKDMLHPLSGNAPRPNVRQGLRYLQTQADGADEGFIGGDQAEGFIRGRQRNQRENRDPRCASVARKAVHLVLHQAINASARSPSLNHHHGKANGGSKLEKGSASA